MNPMTRKFPGCCAHAETGHVVAAELPSALRNVRRFMPGLGFSHHHIDSIGACEAANLDVMKLTEQG
jgi:hypothetical protein